jgi:hypothetical protein
LLFIEIEADFISNRQITHSRREADFARGHSAIFDRIQRKMDSIRQDMVRLERRLGESYVKPAVSSNLTQQRPMDYPLVVTTQIYRAGPETCKSPRRETRAIAFMDRLLTFGLFTHSPEHTLGV